MKSNGFKDWSKVSDVDYLTSVIEKECSIVGGIYLQEMNRVGRELGMLNTNLANPHGLSNFSSYSTANDLAKLCTAAMKNQLFRQIVTTK